MASYNHILEDGGLSIKPENGQEDFRDLFEEQSYSGVRPQLEDYLKSHQNLARISKINSCESNSSWKLVNDSFADTWIGIEVSICRVMLDECLQPCNAFEYVTFPGHYFCSFAPCAIRLHTLLGELISERGVRVKEVGQRDKSPEVSLWDNPSMIYEILEWYAKHRI